MRSGGGIYVSGEIFGDAVAKTYVVVTPGATVHGRVEAREVYVGGTVGGDISADSVHFYDLGVCRGKVKERGA